MIALRNISKTYPGFSLSNVNLEIDQSDYFVLLGMSGAGKTMLLDIIAGFIVPDTGSIWVNNNNITRVPIQKRNIAMVFHDAALFPHLSVRQNIAYPLRRCKNSNRKVEELAELVQAKHLLARYPSDLSAGEKQRIALARALSVAPDVLLLDEPLASLDVPTRSHLRTILRNIHAAGTRIVHVTHDYEEALLLANKVAVIDNGNIVQTGTPEEVFHHPKSEFTARFAGIRNFYYGKTIVDAHQNAYFETSGCKIQLAGDISEGAGCLLLRSEDIIISEEKPVSSASNIFKGNVISLEKSRYGIEVSIHAHLHFVALVTADSVQRLKLEQGKEIFVSFKATALKCITT